MEPLIRNWGWIALRGVAAILFGIIALLNPGMTLVVLVLLFGAYALVDGVGMVVSAVAKRQGEGRWGELLLAGLVGIAIGLFTFLQPRITMAALLLVIAAWAILVGVLEIAAAIRLRRVITGELWLVLSGLLSVGFGLVVAIAPLVGALALALWVGAYALLIGIMQLALAFRLRAFAHPARAV